MFFFKPKRKTDQIPSPEQNEIARLGEDIAKGLKPKKPIKKPRKIKKFNATESTKKEIKVANTLREQDIEDIAKELNIGQKPKVLLDAEEEIKSAIKTIKEQEKPSFFNRLFGKKKKTEEKPAEESLIQTQGFDGIAAIQNNIKKAKEALIKFDLISAKKNYVDAMKIYNKLKPEDQSKVFKDIKEIYNERKSAEEIKL